MRTIITATLFGKKLSVPVAEITHFTSGDKYVTAHYPGGELILEETIKALAAEFDGLFMRVHRRALVAKDRIWRADIKHQWHYGDVWLIGVADPVPVSRTYVRAVTTVLNSAKQAA